MNQDCPHRVDTGAYVLGALDPEGRREFVLHLESCAACRQEVADLQIGGDALPLATTQVEPPPELKDRIMTVVRSEAELLRAAGPDADRVTTRPKRRRRLAALTPRPLAAAAVAAVVAIAILVGVGITGNGSQRTRVVAAKTTLGAAKAHVEITGDSARLVLSNMPTPPAGHVYEVWVQRANQVPRPSGTFYAVDRHITTVDVHGDLRQVQRLLVSVEPKPGSTKPTSPPVIEAALN